MNIEEIINPNRTLQIDSRCRFFFATTKWRKAVNESCNIPLPYIGVVYVVGDNIGSQLRKYFEKKNCENTIIFYLDKANELVELIDRFNEIEVSAKSWCWLQKDGSSKYPQYSTARKEDFIFLTETGKPKILDIYAKLLSDVGFQVFSKFYNVQSLEEFVSALFPYGIEQATTSLKAYGMAGMERYSQYALAGNSECVREWGIEYNAVQQEVKQLSLFDETTSASALIDFVKLWIEARINDFGWFSVAELWETVQNKPYGALPTNYYMWAVNMGIYQALARKEICWGDTYHGQRGELGEIALFLSSTAKNKIAERPRKFDVVVYCETAAMKELSQTLAYIFGVKVEENLSLTLTKIRRLCTDNIQFPLSELSEELHSLLAFEINAFCRQCENVLTAIKKHQDEWKIIVADYDRQFIAKLKTEYDAEKVDLYAKYSYVKGGCRSWLHSKEFFREQIEKYMAQEYICRECGSPVTEVGYEVTRFTGDGQSETVHFTQKQIIGLNKKYLGRNVPRFMCLHCLSEYLGIDEFTLYENMTFFKEQGCTLF